MSLLVSRRLFYSIVMNAMGAAIAAVVAVPAAAYLLLKPKASENEDLVEIADVTALQPGKPQEIVYFRTRVDGWKRIKEKSTAWVVKREANRVTAFSPQCTHLGCAYHFEAEKNQFLCPCHSSIFSIEGAVVAGPAPRPLDRLVTRVEGGKLLIGSELDPGSVTQA